MLGKENLEKVAMTALEAVNMVDKMGRTPGHVAKLAHLMMLSDELIMLTGVEMDQVLPELKDLDAAERADLYAKVVIKFDLADDKVEAVVEDAVGLLMEAADVVKRGVALAASLKK